jgi:hypothetical protein
LCRCKSSCDPAIAPSCRQELRSAKAELEAVNAQHAEADAKAWMREKVRKRQIAALRS